MQEQLSILSQKTLSFFSGFTLRHWKIKTVMAAFLLSLFTAFPGYERFFRHFEENEHHWYAIARQTDHPLTYTPYRATHHDANTSFRLMLPVLGYISGLSGAPLPAKVIFYLAVHALSLFILLYASASLLFRITEDRVTACILCLALAMTYPANSLPGDLWGGYDSLAYALIALSFLATSPPLIFLAILAASFTDERALICSSLCYFFHSLENRPAPQWQYLFSFNKRNSSVLLAWIIYFALRLFLTKHAGFHTNTATAEIAWIVLKEAVSNIPSGILSSIEGFWLPVLLAMYALWFRRQRTTLYFYTACISIITLVAFSVLDITRSMAYVYPCLFVAFLFLRKENLLFLRHLALIVLLCCLFPTYYVYGQNTSQWLFPFPLELIRILTGGQGLAGVL